MSPLARPSQRLEECDLLYEIVAVFSLPAFSGGTILFAAFRLYKLQHVLAKYPPFPVLKIAYHEKEKNSSSIHRNKAEYPFSLKALSMVQQARGHMLAPF